MQLNFQVDVPATVWREAQRDSMLKTCAAESVNETREKAKKEGYATEAKDCKNDNIGSPWVLVKKFLQKYYKQGMCLAHTIVGRRRIVQCRTFNHEIMGYHLS